MIKAVYTLNQSEINLLTSLLNQLEVWFESDDALEIKYYLEQAISSGKITHESIEKVLQLLKKPKQQRHHEPQQDTHEPETASDSWDEMLELLETQKEKQAKQITLGASHRFHLQSAVYNKNLPSRCMLALRRVISRNKGKQTCLRRHI